MVYCNMSCVVGIYCDVLNSVLQCGLCGRYLTRHFEWFIAVWAV